MLEQLDLQNLLLIDIETVPQYRKYGDVPKHLQDLWEQKTAYQRKELLAEDFYERAGIWAEFGKVVCISAGVFTSAEGISFRIKSYCCEEENELLEGFATMLSRQPTNKILCAHNGKEFDFPYLCRRMLINNIIIPPQLQTFGKKPWEVNHLDTMELWKFGDHKNYTSLSLLAAIFNIPTPKDDIDGSEVDRVYWEENDQQRIKTYCQKDVITTAQLIKRFRGEELISEENITYID
ncbi:3'-5' exonuclease [Mucilaginibacter arboris]|uniref:3'-5' exonuclease n=1 Tax=Mucilaginibacter arboris TaxID=2682090 RepID=A0A7K1SX71_9SPHI|nr:3'-5' exonuclease [Mucilaginibacter arboris]MVN21926.1 3'-5' exonuclease [Mucilaginibacter arboris]